MPHFHQIHILFEERAHVRPLSMDVVGLPSHGLEVFTKVESDPIKDFL